MMVEPRFAGMNVTSEVRERLLRGGRRYYEKMGLRLVDAYHRTLRDRRERGDVPSR